MDLGKENVADLLTKPLPKTTFLKLLDKLGLYLKKDIEPSDSDN